MMGALLFLEFVLGAAVIVGEPTILILFILAWWGIMPDHQITSTSQLRGQLGCARAIWNSDL